MTAATRITLLIPAALQAHAGGAEALTVEAGSVRAVFEALRARHEALVQRVLTRDGQLRPFVRVFVREADVRDLNGLETALTDGETVVIVPSVAGG